MQLMTLSLPKRESEQAATVVRRDARDDVVVAVDVEDVSGGEVVDAAAGRAGVIEDVVADEVGAGCVPEQQGVASNRGLIDRVVQDLNPLGTLSAVALVVHDTGRLVGVEQVVANDRVLDAVEVDGGSTQRPRSEERRVGKECRS